MANNISDPQQNALFREVDEDLRHEQLYRLWQQYGMLVVGAAVLVVAIVAGVQGWQAWQDKRHLDDARQFEQALESKGDVAASLGQLATAAHGSGTAVLARMNQAAALARDGKAAQALQAWQQAAADQAADPVYRATALVQWGMLGLENSVAPAEVILALTPASAPGQPMEFSARYVLALATLQQGDTGKAREALASLQDTAGTPASLRARAGQILATLPAPASSVAAPAAPATPAAVAPADKPAATPAAKADKK